MITSFLHDEERIFLTILLSSSMIASILVGAGDLLGGELYNDHLLSIHVSLSVLVGAGQLGEDLVDNLLLLHIRVRIGWSRRTTRWQSS